MLEKHLWLVYSLFPAFLGLMGTIIAGSIYFLAMGLFSSLALLIAIYLLESERI